MRFVAAKGDHTERTARWNRRPYHRPECREVTKQRTVPENWVPYNPQNVPFAEQRRPCKRCRPANVDSPANGAAAPDHDASV